MPFYADVPARRTRQVLADGGCLAVVVAAVLAGRAVHGAVAAAAAPAQRFADGSTSLAQRLTDAGDAVDGTPLVGDEVADVLARSAGSASSLARAAAGQHEALLDLATTLGVLVALVPVLLVVAVRAAQRVRWSWRARDARALAASAAGDRLLALRALQRRGGRALLAVDPDPAGAWREDDPRAVRALADLELAALGVRRGVTAAPTSAAPRSP
ncbi:hypothetical protein [Kineococcus sp. SYSU DK002]|uniref:hypothetical protein n=1 Tax=Kineococcus sp. SYSU DK002 TaxID=3383123 RepID=UPI003D7D8A10